MIDSNDFFALLFLILCIAWKIWFTYYNQVEIKPSEFISHSDTSKWKWSDIY